MVPRVALVTGASRGIGLAIAKRLRADGTTVLAPGRDELDLFNDDSMARYLGNVGQPIDIIVNNAGINHIVELQQLSSLQLAQTLQINLQAPVMLVSRLVAGMKSRGYGRIVNLSSIWSLVSKEGRGAYSAAKAAINGITRTMALELGAHNILVNAVAPGYINTDLTKQNNSPEQLETIARNIPLGRLGEPEEIAELVSFLCSERNSYITGQVIAIDGGYVCR